MTRPGTSAMSRNSTQVDVAKDWAAVATAIDQRLTELGWTQRQLAERYNVSQAVVRELQHHTRERRRSARTLEALSVALGWHPQHLKALSNGHKPPQLDEPISDTRNTLRSRLDTLETNLNGRLNEISAQLDRLITDLATVIKNLRDTVADSDSWRARRRQDIHDRLRRYDAQYQNMCLGGVQA
jgi:transcriptional regulator with XRE-family HTH domain